MLVQVQKIKLKLPKFIIAYNIKITKSIIIIIIIIIIIGLRNLYS